MYLGPGQLFVHNVQRFTVSCVVEKVPKNLTPISKLGVLHVVCFLEGMSDGEHFFAISQTHPARNLGVSGLLSGMGSGGAVVYLVGWVVEGRWSI